MKLILAKIIYWLGIGLIGAIFIGMVGILAWSFLQAVGMVNLLAIGIIVGGFAIVIGYGALFGWAEKEIQKTKGYQINHDIHDKLEDNARQTNQAV